MKKQNVQNMEIERNFCELYKVKIEPDWSKFFTEGVLRCIIDDYDVKNLITLTPDFKITFFEEKIITPFFQKNELDKIGKYPCIVDSTMFVDERDEWGEPINQIFPKVNGIGNDHFGDFFAKVDITGLGSTLLKSQIFYTSLDFPEFQKWFEDSINQEFWDKKDNYTFDKIPSNSIKSVRSFIDSVKLWAISIDLFNSQLLDALEKEDEDYVKIKIISFQKC